MNDTVQGFTEHRLGTLWHTRQIDPGTCSLGSDRRIARLASFGAALAASTGGLSVLTRQLSETAQALSDELHHERVSTASILSKNLAHGISCLAELYDDLLDYVSGGIVRTRAVHIDELVSVANSMGRMVSPHVLFDVESRSVGEHKMIQVNPRHFEQVLACLVKNADIAVSQSRQTRQVTIRTHPLLRQRDRAFLGVRDTPQDYLGVSVIDTGVGMSDRVLARIAEPYFSSRRYGTGSGLGLFVAGNLVEANGGTLVIRTMEGEGTIATMCFPVVG